MKITNPTDYITLGGRLRYFAGRKAGDPIFGKNLIYDNLIWFKEDLEKLDFTVTRNLYNRKLLPIQKEYEILKKTPGVNQENSTLTEEQAASLSSTILEFENTVFAEAETRIIASPVPRRFTLDHLLVKPGGILGYGVFDKLTELAQNDVAQACRCIAFECSTAAAFHILRAIEECVRVLFKSYFPRKDGTRAWGTLTTELDNKPRNPKPDEILLAHLSHIRKRFRNPTDHPEKEYEIEEAEDLVHLSVDIINRCMRDPQVESKRK